MRVVVRLCAFLVFALVALGSTPAVAASPWQNLAQPVFVRADSRELPEAAAMSLAQDSAGFVWVGTQGGLARYDGYRFRTFLPNPSDPKALPDGYVRTMLADANGGIWIGSSSDGLVHFVAATETFRTWRPDRAGRTGPRSASVDAIVAGEDGRLWIGGDGGLDRFDPRTKAFEPVAIAANGAQPVVWSLLIDGAKTVWAGTQDGLYYRPNDAARFRKFTLEGAVRLAVPAIYSLFEDRAGHLWAGSVNTIFDVERNRRSVSAVRSSPLNAASLSPGQQWTITEMTPGVIWTGTDAALSIIDTASHRVRRIAADERNSGGFSSGRLVQFLHDRSGLVWLANHVGGLLLYNPASQGLYELSATRPEIGFQEKGAVAVAAASDGRLWVGGFSGHLSEFTPQTAHATSLTLPNHAAIQTLVIGRDGTLWIGTTDGVCILRAHATAAQCPRKPSQLASQSVYALLEDAERLLVGGSAGLVAQDLATGKVSLYPPGGTSKALTNNQVRVLYRDRRKRLWIGTENGLQRVDADGRITHFMFAPGDPNSIGPGGMSSLLEDRRGRIWAGVNGGPTNVIEDKPGGGVRIRRVGLANGMPHENVDGIAEDARGRIWTATDKGIAVIDPDALQARGFGSADGVTDGAYWAGAVSQAADGTIFFGGLDGITVVAPHALSSWTYAPPVVVTALKLGRRTVPASDANAGNALVDLPPDARDINVEFSALDYSAPQGLRYAYRLDGYDRDWIDADARHRVANYTNLTPGRYTLEVRGTNRLGVWSDHVLQLRIDALPAWYETWWFRLLAGALMLLIAYGLYRIRTEVLYRRQHELEAIVTDRTRELSEANDKLQELSLSDPLTGLRNRRFLSQHLESDVAVSLRRYEDWAADATADLPHDADLLFFLVDLDHLKMMNDQHGHNAGDAVLIQMRERLNEVFRESDFVVRWGGDEFLAVARGSRRSDAAKIAERICYSVASRPFTIGGTQTLVGSVSVGYAAYPLIPSAPGTVTWPQVVALADQALYLSKQAGRSTWFGLTATFDVDAEMLAKLLEHDPEEALQAGALEIVTRGMPSAS
jgi:diguanylate cyclase (GGDEF)-like protein